MFAIIKILTAGFILVYYPTNTEYDLIINKYPFHDSGIADENLSDETGSIEEDLNHQENQQGIHSKLVYLICNSESL